MSKYIGLTIGPIAKTMSSAKDTGQLWGSSYIFSYIMKKIIEKLKDCREFVIPYVDDKELFIGKNEIGLFSDRMIFKTEAADNDMRKLKDIIDEILDELANDFSSLLKVEKSTIKEYLEKYFKIYYLAAEIIDNPIIEMNNYLDSIELMENYVARETRNYLMDALTNDNIKKSILFKDAFENTNSRYIRSIEEIASEDLLKLIGNKDKFIVKKEDREDINSSFVYNEIFNQLKENGKEEYFKKHYKYIAIVQADGDNIGKLIKSLDTDKKRRDFSKDLLEFAKSAHEIIKEHNGMTIYAGGDDLLFFAPVVSDKRNIFDLINCISNCFDGIFSKYPVKPTMSFGLSIVYYKYPLYESLEKTRNLLFGVAKKYKFEDSKEIEKNAIAFEVIKHSGQGFGCTFGKSSKEYEEFLKLLAAYCDGEKTIASMYHILNNDELLFKTLHNSKNIDERLDNYFNNKFIKDVHETPEIKEFIKSTKQVIKVILKENISFAEKVKKINAILLTIRFFNENGGDE